jgi:hypothetical protein
MLDECDAQSKRATQERFPPLEPWRPCPHTAQLDSLHETFIEEWGAQQGPRPSTLYHYTSLGGLTGILKSHQVWVTDVAYLNDALEMQLADALIRECVENAQRNRSPLVRELLRRSEVSGSPESAGQGYYVACFCKSRDLLSQWRAYANDGGGYAVGFSAHEMATEGHVRLRRVIYEPSVQRTMVEDCIRRACDAFERVADGKSVADLDKDHTLPSFAQLLASHLSEFLVAFKHDAFAQEDEWRIVLPFARDAHSHFVRFREKSGMPVPYMALHPRTPRPGLPLLPIVEVVHGPTLHPGLTKKSLHLLLQANGYDHVEVGGSVAPLRA